MTWSSSVVLRPVNHWTNEPASEFITESLDCHMDCIVAVLGQLINESLDRISYQADMPSEVSTAVFV